MIKFEGNVSAWAASLAGVSTRTMNRAFAHSANSTVINVRTYLLKALGEQGIQRKAAASKLDTEKAFPNKLSASLKDNGRRIPLASFGARSKVVKTDMGKRIGVTIVQGGVRALVPGGFLVTMKSGKTGIFQRVGSERLPIKQMYASSITTIIRQTQGLQESVKSYAAESFRKNFARDFTYYKAKETGNA